MLGKYLQMHDRIMMSIFYIAVCFLILVQPSECFIRQPIHSCFLSTELIRRNSIIPQLHHPNDRTISNKLMSSAKDFGNDAVFSSFMPTDGTWYEMDGCQVLLPSIQYLIPRGVIHFIGGFLAGSATSLTYGPLLQHLANRGFLIISTTYDPFNSNHQESAADISWRYQSCYRNSITKLYRDAMKDIPTIGLTHSLGGKLMSILCSRREDRKKLPPRAGNIFLAFNNFDAKESFEYTTQQARDIVENIKSYSKASPDLLAGTKFVKDAAVKIVTDRFGSDSSIGNFLKNSIEKDSETNGIISSAVTEMSGIFSSSLGAVSEIFTSQSSKEDGDAVSPFDKFLNHFATNRKDFIPTAADTWKLILASYNVQNNILVKFQSDDIDQSADMKYWLQKRGCDVRIVNLPGNHLSPNLLSPQKDLQVELELILNSMIGRSPNSEGAWERRDEYLKLPGEPSRNSPPTLSDNTSAWDNDDM